METITCDIRSIPPVDRQALERLVGRRLEDDQQIRIQVLEPAGSDNRPMAPSPEDVPPSWNVYEGLDDEEIERLDQAIRQRANLTRVFE